MSAKTPPDPTRQLARIGLESVPLTIRNAGPDATRAFFEFFTATIRNKNTRMAYARACARFLDWCDGRGVRLEKIAPMTLAAYVEMLSNGLPGEDGTTDGGENGGIPPMAPSSVKQHLAAIRMLFDWLATRHIVDVNPARSVKGPKHTVVEGITPAFDVKQARLLLESIDISKPRGLRDRALLASMIYTAARVSAVCNLRVKDFAQDGSQWILRFGEKGGKRRQIPCSSVLEKILREYIDATGIGDAVDTPLFRTFTKSGRPTARGVSRVEAHYMLKSRLKKAGLPANLSSHSFRATTATDLLAQGIPLEDVQYLLGHADPRTTRLYDRRKKEITRRIVERISV
ncbi:MAG: tyrosine-type recombinase/integrase [Phycisphaerae bacterium]|nr:tyrosine-type recombinase/integrase [Phycisphaerae bacterium]